MLCPHCQTPNEDGAKFCEQCGGMLMPAVPPKNPLKPVVIALSCVAVCCVIALVLILILPPLLQGVTPPVSDADTSPATTVTTATTPTEPTVPTVPPSLEAENTEALYEEVLRKYIEAYPWEMFEVLPEIGEMTTLYNHHSDIGEIGYAYLDTDGDGQRELLIGAVDAPDRMIYDMYTVADGELRHILSSAERAFYRLRDDGKLVYTWSGGAAVHGNDLCRVNDEKNDVVAECRVAMDAFYAEENGYITSMGDPTVQENSWFIAEGGTDESLYRQVSETEAYRMQDEICKGLIPIAYQSLTSLPFYEEPVFTAESFNGMTLEQATAVAGDGYKVAEYLYRGGWGEVWYPNDEAPYSFFYRCALENMGQPITGSELVVGVGIRPKVGPVTVAKGVESSMTLEELQAVLPNGEAMENPMEGGTMFTCVSADGRGLEFYWYDGDTSKAADWILLVF